MAKLQWTDEFLDEMRGIADPLADDVVQKMYAANSLDAVNELLVSMIANDDVVPTELPEYLQQYFEASAVLPDWADKKLIEIGESVFMDLGALSLLALMSAALPVCYSMSRAVQVLATTQQLESHTTRRILETAQLIIDVMQTGGLSAGGRGIRSVQRVRLMHAAIRHLIALSPNPEHRPPQHFGDVLAQLDWDVARNGVPICQEDMGGTVLTFSWIVIRSFERMDQHLTDEQKQAYYHCWRVVGHIMGVDTRLLPERWEQGRALFRRMQERQCAPTPEGQLMTKRILATTDELLVERVTRLPAVTHHLPRLFIHMLNDSKTCDALDVPKLSWKERFVALPLMHFVMEITSWISGVSGSNKFLHKIQHDMAWTMVQKLATLPRNDQRGLFAMPQSLLQHWEPPG